MVCWSIAVLAALGMLEGCAKGFEFRSRIESELERGAADGGGRGPKDASIPASMHRDAGDAGGAGKPVPCNQKDVEACDCKGTDKQGEQVCMFDKTSPRDGFLGPCENCPPPDKIAPDASDAMDAPDPCDDGNKNGTESDTDCGGADCDPCPLDSTCVANRDCHFGTCMGGTCKLAGSGGAGGNVGAGGTGGAPTGTGAVVGGGVADCQGQPDFTACAGQAAMCPGMLVCLQNNCLCLI
jgi:hypothetical protein